MSNCLSMERSPYDGAVPSGNSVAALVLSRLSRLTGEMRWRKAVDLQLSWPAGAARDYPAGHGFTMLSFLDELWPAAELVVAAREPPEELRDFLQGAPRLGLTVLLKTGENADALAALVPFTRDYPVPEQGTQYYLCRDGACARPVERIPELTALFAHGI